EPLRFLGTINRESPIYYLSQLLNPEEEHVVVGDLNLHHPAWAGVQCLERHRMADDLLQITQEAGLQLLTPPGVLTWEAKGITSTIDLVFGTRNIAQKLIRCKRDDHLESGSDHHPITTQLDTTPTPSKPQNAETGKRWTRKELRLVRPTFPSQGRSQ